MSPVTIVRQESNGEDSLQPVKSPTHAIVEGVHLEIHMSVSDLALVKEGHDLCMRMCLETSNREAAFGEKDHAVEMQDAEESLGYHPVHYRPLICVSRVL